MPGGGSIGHRLDGRANHNLNMGKIFATAANSRALYPVLELSLAANKGKVALMRGPILYCVEAADNADISVLSVPRHWEFASKLQTNALLGTCINIGPVGKNEDHQFDAVSFTAIPSFAWGNRTKGAMAVWINEPDPTSKNAAPKK